MAYNSGIKDILKVTVQRGYEDKFKEYCREMGIPHRQYPDPVTWAFRVENTSAVPNVISLIAGLPFVSNIEDMPTVSLT